MVSKQRENSVDYNTIQPGRVTKQIPQYPQNDRIAAYQRRAQTRGNSNNVAQANESKSPDKYTINKNLVVNLNDPVTKPVKRENSNTTNATGITAVTGATASTGVSGNQQNTKNKAFYNTQYAGKGFFPQAKNDKNNL